MASANSRRLLRLGNMPHISHRSSGLTRQLSRPDWRVPRSLPTTGALQARSLSLNPFATSTPKPVNASPPEPLSDSFAPEVARDGFRNEKSQAMDTTVSNISVDDTPTLLPSAFSEVGTALSDAASSITVPAYQAGDMAAAGLTSWWPSGIMNMIIEQAHLYTGGPWVNTLVLTTIAMRTLLLQPQIRAARAAARLMPYQARLEKVQAETVAAAQSGDVAERQRIALERQAIHQEAGVKTTDMMMAPLVMLPTQIGMFLGVKYMCDLPLPQLAAESWQWIPSLAVADPTYLLPLINMVLVQGTLWLAQKDSATEKAGHTLNAFRVIALTGLPVMSTLPAAVNIVVLTQSLFGIVQSTTLRTNIVRRALGMPLVDPMMKPPTIKDSFVKLQQVVAKAREEAQNQASQGR